MSEGKPIAHLIIESKERTKDVIMEENVSFSSLFLPEIISRGLSDAGFHRPSPIQLKAIPVGRCGFDLTVKSKSGTGKTLVFGLIALETINLQKNSIQVLILVPTREIAVQIHDVLKTIGKYMKELNVQTFIGGLSFNADKSKCSACHIAVGTPGRVKQLVQDGYLAVNSVRLFVLDEADKLMENSFQDDINDIFNSLPDKKQVIMCSATYPNQLEGFLNDYMLSPTQVSAELETPLLLGLKQFVRIVTSPPNVVQQTKVKNDELLNILSTVSFTQCLIFSNYQTRAESISYFLNQNGWNSKFISAAQNQTDRLGALTSLKEFKCKTLISTDLMSRGIDAANVDLVINYDIPADAMTYLHRMGRAGRYGSAGLCINIALNGPELKILQNILGIIGGQNLSMSILDDSLDVKKDFSSDKNLLIAEVPDNIKELTKKCKAEIIGMKKTSKKTKHTKSESTNKPTTMDLGGDNQELKRVIENKLSNTNISSVLEHLASGTFEMEGIKNHSTLAKNAQNVSFQKDLELSLLEQKNKSNIKKANLESFFVLKQLASEGSSVNAENTKLNDQIETCLLNSVGHKGNVFLKTEQTNRDFFFRNKALLGVAKSLSSMETCEEDTEYLTQYLDILKTKETPKSTCQEKSKNIDITNKNKDPMAEDCENIIENIFAVAYRCQVMDNCKKWQDYLPVQDKEKLTDNYILENKDEKSYDEYPEDEYCEDYKFEMEKTIDVHFGEGMVQKDDEQDEYSFMKWIPVHQANSRPSLSKNIDMRIDARSSDPLVPIYLPEKLDVFNQPSTAEAADSYYHEQFNNYFQHCSTSLWQTGLSFSSSQSFDEWFFTDWQNQLTAVRNFVQKKIYIEEMSRLPNK